ncbi:MAG: hypothetical protein V4612_02935, partial [Pseudomonadota bacterium]
MGRGKANPDKKNKKDQDRLGGINQLPADIKKGLEELQNIEGFEVKNTFIDFIIKSSKKLENIESVSKYLSNINEILKNNKDTNKNPLRDTACFTSLCNMINHIPKFNEDFLENKAHFFDVINSEIRSSITGMQAGKGMIKKENFDQLKEWCTFGGELDKSLLSSITGMQAGKGMIKKEDFDQLKEWCT